MCGKYFVKSYSVAAFPVVKSLVFLTTSSLENSREIVYATQFNTSLRV